MTTCHHQDQLCQPNDMTFSPDASATTENGNNAKNTNRTRKKAPFCRQSESKREKSKRNSNKH